MTLPQSTARPEARVLVVDDSAFMRRTIERMVNRVPGMTVVGAAADGIEAVRRTLELRPDIITMDVEMPHMDGVHAVMEIMRSLPTPVVMLSTRTRDGAETTIRALEAGAVDCVAKPSALSFELGAVEEQLAAALRRALRARLQRRRPAMQRPAPVRTASPVPAAASRQIVVIGASTGGPPALTEVIPHLPAGLAAGVIVVQHMPAAFTGALARRLDAISPLAVKEAEENDLVGPGRVLVAPGDRHLIVTAARRVRLSDGPAVHGVRPAADVTLESVAKVYGAAATVAILTGMGKDGAAGAAMVEAGGGRVIVQDEATSVVYGMPRVARELARSATEVPVEDVAGAIVAALAEPEAMHGR